MSRFVLLAAALGACTPLASNPSDQAHALAGEVDGAKVFADVVSLAALHAADTPRACADMPKAPRLCHYTNEKARAFVRARLASLGLSVEDDGPLDETGSTNVFAKVTGTSRPDEVLLVGAHFDAFYEGADDNSTGVAVMLELARVVSQHPLPRTVIFVGFDLEELTSVGATRFRGAMKSGPKVSLILDSLGYTSATQGGLIGFPVPSVGNFLAAIGNDVSGPRVEALLRVVKDQAVPPVQGIVAPGRGDGPLTGNLLRSDHAPFWLAGDSAVFITDTSNFRSPYYHRETDTPDTLDPEFLTGSARIAAMAIAVWSEE